jgi:hypothetical protein
LHNVSAGKTVVELESRDDYRCHRVYWRSTGTTDYQILGSPGPEESFEDIVTATEPVLYMRISQWKESQDRRSIEIYNRGILQVDLRKIPMVTPLQLGDIVPPGVSVSQLLRVSDRGDRIQAIVGGDALRGYAIVELDLVARRMEQLDHVTLSRFAVLA